MEEVIALKVGLYMINKASAAGFWYSIPSSACNQKPQGDTIFMGGYKYHIF